jgi:hypothetical protein
MEAVFIELPAFERHREEYLSDDDFKNLQKALLTRPKAGDVIEGTGGLRKVRFGDRRRGKGSRGGIRIIYYWWLGGAQFWLFTIYDKNEMSDLSGQQKKILKELLDREIDSREKR